MIADKRYGTVKFINFRMLENFAEIYSAFTGSGFCPVPGHVILMCKLHISGKI